MKRLGVLIALAAVPALTASAQAQNRLINPDCTIICTPVFVAQPGAIITNFIDQPSGTESSTDFLLRWTTAFGTQFNPLFFAFLVQWTPDAENALGGKANSPVLVYGPGFHVLGGAGAFLDMKGAARIFLLDLLPLIVYSGSANQGTVSSPGSEPSDYTHKLFLEADFFLNIGKLIDPNNRAPYINAIQLHAILDYGTDVFGDAIPTGSDASRWVLLVGATLPIAPIPGGN